MLALAALDPANPQAVFASFGLLRILAEAGHPARLAWRDGQHAELHGVDWEAVAAAVPGILNVKRAELNWSDTVKKFTRYRELMADTGHHPWLEAFWLESAGGKTVETKLDMTAGAQKLFATVLAMIRHLRDQPVAPLLARTLREPWDYADRVAGLGFDPGAVRSGASVTGGKPPTSAPQATMSLAGLLAFEALPLLPARWLGGGRDEIVWALPERPTGFAKLRQMLLAAPALRDEELAAQGWSRWACSIGRNGKFGFLYPAARTTSDGGNPGDPRITKALKFQDRHFGKALYIV
jgi:hypothetical protein